MPTPKRFCNENELVKALRQCQWKKWLDDWRKSTRAAARGRSEEATAPAWFKKQCERWLHGKNLDTDLAAIIYCSVGQNTFRAFHHMPEQPSETFREWALEVLHDGTRLEFLRRVDSQSEYRKWLYALSENFRQFWGKRMGKQIPYGPSLKLPNLLMKQVFANRNKISDNDFNKLVGYLEVPLDSFTIQAVANRVDPFPNRDSIGHIPSSATMNFVRSHEMYEAFQNGIRQIACKAGVPPIALDCLAWNEGHG